MPSAKFGDRLSNVFASYGQLCLGIDPHAALLERWELPDSADGAREFGMRVLEAAVGRVGMIKPQVAFFERHGSAGYAALETVIAAARSAGILVIADAKRGDIGSSVDAYGEAWLTPGSPLESDAMTINPFQGVDSNADVFERAREAGKGVFVLAATSNPEARVIQSAVISVSEGTKSTVSGAIVEQVEALNAHGSGLGSIGVVIGATLELDELGVHLAASGQTPILVPGFGAQGARLVDAGAIFGAAASRMIATVSRSVLGAGPDQITAALDSSIAELAAGLQR